jgi:ribosomal protein S18 acetylase RimI-like enzyme
MSIEYKQATPVDAAFLAPMNKRMIEDQGHRNPMSIPELESRMENWLRGEYEAVYAEENGEILGYALFRRESGHIYLRQLFVERDKRTRGTGRKLFQWLERNRWEARKIVLEVLTHNEAGIAFWKAMGFREYSLTMEKQGAGA